MLKKFVLASFSSGGALANTYAHDTEEAAKTSAAVKANGASGQFFGIFELKLEVLPAQPVFKPVC